MIIYTDFMPSRFGGYTIGPITLIRPKHKNDLSLHAHEAVHRKQFRDNPLFGIAYLFSKKQRLKYELQAFAAQLRVNPSELAIYAKLLATNYDLDITTAEALVLLEKAAATN